MTIHSIRTLLVALVLAGSAFAQIDSPNFKFVAINVSGAANTVASGINNGGVIVGFFQVGTNCIPDTVTPTCHTHGFKLANRRITRLDIPGALNTFIFGLNDFGDTAGIFQDSAGKFHGFLRHHTGQVQRIDPTGTLSGAASAVNNSLTVVGGNFSWHNGKFTKVDFTTPGNGESQNLSGISNPGVIVGTLFHQDFFNGILKAGSDFDLFPRINGSDTHVLGVNGRGDVVGFATAIPGQGFYSPHVERGEGTSDKPERPLNPIPVSFPGASQTAPNAINFNQAIVGSYQDKNFKTHGFLAVH
ncbi:MAG TPA: hypothetical protein VJN64_02795 [Terriglobales bacterium]|nr:hypothetical protein [Terriglobales bacterium]